MVKKVTDLGFQAEIANISTNEILNNEPAIKMLLNNCKRLENENNMLKQDLNRQATIERTLVLEQKNKKIASFLSIISTILISFGINFITNNQNDFKGILLLVIGIVIGFAQLYYSFKEEK